MIIHVGHVASQFLGQGQNISVIGGSVIAFARAINVANLIVISIPWIRVGAFLIHGYAIDLVLTIDSNAVLHLILDVNLNDIITLNQGQALNIGCRG